MAEDSTPVTAYEVLSVPRDATADEIKSAYRRLCMAYHPDKDVHARAEIRKQLEARFIELQDAYQILSDPDKRQKYDKLINRKSQQNTNQSATRSASSTNNSSSAAPPPPPPPPKQPHTQTTHARNAQANINTSVPRTITLLSTILILVGGLQVLGSVFMHSVFVTELNYFSVEDRWRVLLYSVISFISSVVVVIGGYAMRRGKNLSYAIIGAVAAIFPGATCGCIGMPFGVLALILLFRPSIRKLYV